MFRLMCAIDNAKRSFYQGDTNPSDALMPLRIE